MLKKDLSAETYESVYPFYNNLFQKSLYRVGELWESNRISVAKEHLATAITEGLLNLVYPKLFEPEQYRKGRTILISCTANEFHQIGGKMVADVCELNGWDSHFLGANTPVNPELIPRHSRGISSEFTMVL